jgi:hypothetical protein
MSQRNSRSHHGPLDQLNFDQVWQLSSVLACVLYHFRPANIQKNYVADEIWPHISHFQANCGGTTLESLRMAMACKHFHPVIKRYGVETFDDKKKDNLQTSRALPQHWMKTYSWKFQFMEHDVLSKKLEVDDDSALVRDLVGQYFKSVSKLPLPESSEQEDEVRSRKREQSRQGRQRGGGETSYQVQHSRKASTVRQGSY